MEGMILIDNLVFWHWWVLALVLMILEITMFGAFFLLWIGLSAAIVGVALLFAPGLSWQYQIIIWAVLSVLSVLGWRVYRKNNPVVSEEPTLNQRGKQYIGRMFTLDDPVVNGQGKIRVDDTVWKAEAEEDMEAGTKVKVIFVHGTALKIERA